MSLPLTEPMLSEPVVGFIRLVAFVILGAFATTTLVFIAMCIKHGVGHWRDSRNGPAAEDDVEAAIWRSEDQGEYFPLPPPSYLEANAEQEREIEAAMGKELPPPYE